jgi:NitT/TauT family transport system substrate-binding protein
LAGGIMFVSKKMLMARPPGSRFAGNCCVIPYEVTRARHFADEGLDVRLVYTRGGNVAMQALVGGSVDYAGNASDVALQASHMEEDLPLASTGRLPLFARQRTENGERDSL